MFSYAPGAASNTAAPTFTRSTTATYKDIAGTRQTAGINALRDGHYIGGVRTTLLEGASTNHFLNSGAPATQTSPSLATGTYTLWMEGTGSIAVAAGTATITGGGTASAGVTVTFTVTVAGTVTYTVTGSPALAQAENLAFASSYIPTTSAAVVRGADSDVMPYSTAPQAMTVYAKFVELGTAYTGALNERLLEIGGGVLPNGFWIAVSGGGLYFARYEGAATGVQSIMGTKPTIGQTVELRATLSATGVVQINQSLDGGAETTATASATQALSAVWSANTLALNSDGTGGRNGVNAFQSVKIAAGTKSLAEMRAL